MESVLITLMWWYVPSFAANEQIYIRLFICPLKDNPWSEFIASPKLSLRSRSALINSDVVAGPQANCISTYLDQIP